MNHDTRIKDSLNAIQLQYGRLPRSLFARYSILGLSYVCSYSTFKNLYAGNKYKRGRIADEVCEHLEIIAGRTPAAQISNTLLGIKLGETLAQDPLWRAKLDDAEPFGIQLQSDLDKRFFPSQLRVLWLIDDSAIPGIAQAMPYLVRGYFKVKSLRNQYEDAHLILALYPGTLIPLFQERAWRRNKQYQHITVESLENILEWLGYHRKGEAIVRNLVGKKE